VLKKVIMSKELTITVVAIGIYFSVAHSLWTGLAVSIPAWIISRCHNLAYLAYHTLGRDLLTIYRFIQILYKTQIAKIFDMGVAAKFMKTAALVPEKTMITFCGEDGDTIMTFREAREKSCQVARFFKQKGFKKGDVIAIVMENRVDYCCYWLGLSMIGVVPALVNSNLRKNGLLHTITVAHSKAVIFSGELEQGILDVSDELGGVDLYCIDGQVHNKAVNLSKQTKLQSTDDLETMVSGYTDDLFYIYTSGTTGLPKAAIIKNSRFMFTVYALYSMAKVYKDDILYSPLPMYHSSAGAMITGNAMLEGVSIVSRKKFSARNYWKDCCRNNVTVAQYIGEVARYLHATPPSKYDNTHKVRLLVGNGMRVEIWQQFYERFGRPMINEFYGSTEGNCSVGNISGKVGAVGFISVLFPMLFPLGIVAIDEDTREPLRDGSGLCVPCPPGKSGEIVGRIDKGHPVRDFHGYSDKEATNKKIIRNVWRKGDACFRSGDILEMDELGWVYFKDRSGDTFRWKGENVSTAEVESNCSSIIGLQDCVVYGVEVKGCEGKAGMLAIPDPNRLVDLTALTEGLEARLPSYARPVFIRLTDKIDLTATFKLKKRELQKEGFRRDLISDPLYILDNITRSYVEMTEEHHRLLQEERLKL